MMITIMTSQPTLTSAGSTQAHATLYKLETEPGPLEPTAVQSSKGISSARTLLTRRDYPAHTDFAWDNSIPRTARRIAFPAHVWFRALSRPMASECLDDEMKRYAPGVLSKTLYSILPKFMLLLVTASFFCPHERLPRA